MYSYEIEEARELIAGIGRTLDRIGRLAGDEPGVVAALDAARRQAERLDGALWTVEPAPDDNPIADTVEERYL